MFACVGRKPPERPDFSLPIRPEWRKSLREKYLSNWHIGGKRLLVHRPIVVRHEWNGRNRNPDPAAYDSIYKSIRDQFFVVSVADLSPGREWIDGPYQAVDMSLYSGELTFEDMAALWAEADLVFCNAGFGPVLAQAVGTPVICVYGGRESYRTTQRAGAHLARTLPVDPINPCDCHGSVHNCDKRIDVAKALPQVREFAESVQTRILLFGTFYIDSPDRENLTRLWQRLHIALNERDCDFLAVDSQSPIAMFADWQPPARRKRMVFNFPDNIGHLSRPQVTAGRDGWGRAFCKGLEIACDLGYEYAVHIEGDSLCRLKVADVVAQMRAEKIDVASTTVEGTRIPGANNGWCETGLMFFSTAYLKRSNFITKYDWPHRQKAPTPERWIRQCLLEPDKSCKFVLMPWKARRADRNQITKENVIGLGLDWVTHQHDSAQQEVYRKFADAALGGTDGNQPTPVQETASTHEAETILGTAPQPKSSLLKVNLGCGTNKLPGWQNHDADVDIAKRLPWADASISHISIEHCVEHVPYKAAIGFFQEAFRVLTADGVLRVTVPSLEQIAACDDSAYHQFTSKWQPLGPTKRGAMHAIIYAHGHECAWNKQLLIDTLFFAGFEVMRGYRPGESDDPLLRGVEGHGRVIGDIFNTIESCTIEARKSALPIAVPVILRGEPVAIVLGGAECWEADLRRARAIIGDRPIEYYVINDQIKGFPEPCIACTLHPDKLGGQFAWLLLRRKAGLPDPLQVWAHRSHAHVTHNTAAREWQGSSGLFAVQIARRNGRRRIIGCGVPMTVDGAHYIRHQKWQSAIAFRAGWTRCRDEILPYFRSMSGWTAEQFGIPNGDWLNS
jgi:predicted SAM-dependent methyltransferase